MTQNDLKEMIREIKNHANWQIAEDENSHIALTAPIAIAVLEEVFEGLPNG